MANGDGCADGARRLREEREQVELLGSQVELVTAQVDATGRPVDLQLTHALHGDVGRSRTAEAALHGADTSDQLAKPERLDHIVVGTQLEQAYAIELVLGDKASA